MGKKIKEISLCKHCYSMTKTIKGFCGKCKKKKKIIKITSTHIKYAVMQYFRFKRQWLCATECLNKDVIAINKKEVIEVEIKISKSDLWNGEAKKWIHNRYNNPENFNKWMLPNRYYICIPDYLLEEAKKWIKKINNKYGILLYQQNEFNKIHTIKTAKTIHKNINPNFSDCIMKRVCSENINWMKKFLNIE